MTLKTQFLAAAGVLALLSAPAAFAQDMAPETTPPTEATPADPAAPAAGADVSDAQVESFATAMTQVQALNERYAARLASEADPAAKAEIQQQANAEMTAAVEASGLTPQDYNRIAAAAQTDANLRGRIGQALQADSGQGADASATEPDPQAEPQM